MAMIGFLYKLVVGGRHYVTDEWSIGLHLHSDAIVVPNPQLYAAAFSTWWADSDSKNSSGSWFDFVKLNGIDPLTGRYAPPEMSFTYNVVGPVVGTVPGGIPQASVAVSLTTDSARGRGHAGRYFPPTGMSVAMIGADGRLGAADRDQIVTASVKLIKAINAVGLPKVVIFSKAAQTVTPVTGVRVGRVVDTQRRRRSSLDEDYAGASVVV